MPSNQPPQRFTPSWWCPLVVPIGFANGKPPTGHNYAAQSYSISADYSYKTNTITLSDSSGGSICLNPDALYSSTITTPDGTTFNTADLLAQTTATVGYSSPYTYFSQADAANALFSHSSALQALEAYELAMGGRDILADFFLVVSPVVVSPSGGKPPPRHTDGANRLRGTTLIHHRTTLPLPRSRSVLSSYHTHPGPDGLHQPRQCLLFNATSMGECHHYRMDQPRLFLTDSIPY